MKTRRERAFVPAMVFAALLALAPDAWANTKFQTISTGAMGPGDAVLELSPEMEEDGRLIVRFAVNTHSVNLGEYDLRRITSLEYEGKVFAPSKADSLVGHHGFGKIVFDVGKQIQSFRITIRGLPAVEERVYEW